MLKKSIANTVKNMSMIAEYIMVDEETLESLMDLNNDELTDKLFEIEESEKFESIGIDKIWDALHCFLTGVSAVFPIEGDKLSEAIVGTHVFIEDDDVDFITCIENEELAEIIQALEKIEFSKLASDFDPKILKENEVYPNGIWDDDKTQLLTEMETAIADLLDFYKSALETKHHVVVSIL
ncbi:MAG: YfbM family protein [Bacteroidales bacterium]|nr:YfbM family protein [Bacteroidales bacterium]